MTQPYSRPRPPRPLEGARLLIVEDDFIILLDLEAVLREAGAAAIDACRTVEEGLARAGADGIDAAILDVRIGAESVAPVARQLALRRIPFAFYTGQAGSDPVRAEWPDRAVIGKPAHGRAIVATVAALLRSSRAKR